jgi:FkbM family methyltransferase
MGLGELLYSGFRQVKAGVEHIPGAHRAYKWVTTRTGEGKVYEIVRGPMAGMRWRRRNCLPFWYHLGIYEPETSRFLAAHLRPGDTFWDLGANAGYHTLMGARAVGPTGRVISVEPDPGTCKILREQLEINGITNCTVVQAAVSNRPGRTVLIRRASDPRGNALQQIDNPAIDNKEGDAVEVPCVTMDELSSLYPAPRLIKMDIEGAEVLALPGGRSFLSGVLSGKERPERLLVAVHGDEARDFCRDFLSGLGYSLETAPALDAHSLVAVDRASAARHRAVAQLTPSAAG